MDQQTQVVEQKAVETETTQASSPQAQSPITGDKTIQGEANDQTPVVESSDITSTMTEEQRRAFQEMRLENKRLKEERETKSSGESAFNVLRQQTPPAQSQPVRIENYTDPTTGETNWQAYNAAQQLREQQILQHAKFEARTEVQETLDEERARTKYPDLMNNPVIEKQIASRWLYEKIQGNNVSITDIASEFARNFKAAVTKAEKIGAEKALTEVSDKEKAGLTAASQSQQGHERATSQKDHDRLVSATRRGDYDAVAARLAKIPWANK